MGAPLIGEYVAIGASGGKDSTVLAYIMKTLNDRYSYGLKLVLLSIGGAYRGTVLQNLACWNLEFQQAGRFADNLVIFADNF